MIDRTPLSFLVFYLFSTHFIRRCKGVFLINFVVCGGKKIEKKKKNHCGDNLYILLKMRYLLFFFNLKQYIISKISIYNFFFSICRFKLNKFYYRDFIEFISYVLLKTMYLSLYNYYYFLIMCIKVFFFSSTCIIVIYN